MKKEKSRAFRIHDKSMIEKENMSMKGDGVQDLSDSVMTVFSIQYSVESSVVSVRVFSNQNSIVSVVKKRLAIISINHYYLLKQNFVSVVHPTFLSKI